jgi:hypothetical protein
MTGGWPAVRGLRLAEIEAARRQRHRSALLYLTDRCPVGCAHCSVDARPGTPPLDLALLSRLLDGLCAVPGLDVVGVSGGEPFVERRGLSLAVDRLATAGRQIVLYTSGVWAHPPVPGWIHTVLRRAAHVVLSTDAAHAERLPAERFVAAARAVRGAGTPLSVQVADTDGTATAAATALLRRAFGPDWAGQAELSAVPLLPYGRAAGSTEGAAAPARAARRPGAWWGTCAVADAPVLRYDGRIVGCCNEQVLAGLGPAALRRSAGTAAETVAAFADLRADPHLRAAARIGLGPLTRLPDRTDLAERSYADPCRLCWALAGRADAGPASTALLRAGELLTGVPS